MFVFQLLIYRKNYILTDFMICSSVARLLIGSPNSGLNSTMSTARILFLKISNHSITSSGVIPLLAVVPVAFKYSVSKASTSKLMCTCSY